MNKFEKMTKLVVELNNYFDDNDFIMAVQNFNNGELEKDFELATYDTTVECEEYIKLYLKVFADELDEKMLNKIKKIPTLRFFLLEK
jgi:hypothetical protein